MLIRGGGGGGGGGGAQCDVIKKVGEEFSLVPRLSLRKHYRIMYNAT